MRVYLAHPRLVGVLADVLFFLVGTVVSFFTFGYVFYIMVVSVLIPEAPPIVGMAMGAGMTPLVLLDYLIRDRKERLQRIRRRYESATED